MFNRSINLAVLSVLGLATFASGIGVTAAYSFPLAPPSAIIEIQPNDITPVQYMQHQGGGWQSQRDGNRCPTRMGNCQHYHQGYYYQNPWWALPFVVGGIVANANQGNGNHFQWCSSRYHSYNARTNMWVGSNGMRHRCNGGY